ncbi:MAG: hypothetical protein SCJ93_10580 [Bacillota bacterium]|nr:hypothetical protein [Bacillota bacterium]
MKRNIFKIILCTMIISTVISINVSATEDFKEINIEPQPRFSNITAFDNEFYITSSGKAMLTSAIDARDADEVKIIIWLQRYSSGNWDTIKSWSTRKEGTFTGLSESWDVLYGYQYRMVSFGYVYGDGSLLESTTYISQPVIY